ncbi:MAG: DUF4190 domain-containing protein [Candidatus Saccharibacteria bacterium]
MSEKTTDMQPVELTPAAQPTPQNGLAIASMVTGIVSVVSCWTLTFGLMSGIVALTLGIIGLKKPGNKGMAITGIVTGSVAILISVVLITILLVVANTETVRQSPRFMFTQGDF